MLRRKIAILAALGTLVLQSHSVTAAEQAGVAAAVRGQVQIAERTGVVGRQVASGQPVFLGNAITSGPDSGLQIILLDETTFTIGPNSEIAIDEFVYDPGRSAGKVTASVSKGVFRFVTGKIARDDPGSMQVKLPTGSIGIRGTIAVGQVDQSGQQVVLIGPGAGTESNTQGGLNLNANGTQQTVTRSGYGSTLGSTGLWQPPERFDPAQIAALLALLGGSPSQQQTEGQQPGPTGTATQNSGASSYVPGSTANALMNLNNLLIFAQVLQSQESIFGRDDSRNLGSSIGSAGGGQTTGISDGPTTFDQLRAVNSGQFYWIQSNVPLSGVSNTYRVALDINFGARTVGGGNSAVNITGGTLPSGSFLLPIVSYAGSAGFASFNFQNTGGISDFTNCGGPCISRLNAQLLNQGGVTAANLLHMLTIRNSSDTVQVTSGSGTAVGRIPGTSPLGP